MMKLIRRDQIQALSSATVGGKQVHGLNNARTCLHHVEAAGNTLGKTADIN